VVQPVKETIREPWFQDAIREKTDLFVVIGHVGIRMQEFRDIYATIRKQNWFTPIAFFGGHVHVRDATTYDAKSYALASGRYLETIGWMSIDGIDKKTEDISKQAVSFRRRYIDNNLLGFYHHSGLNESIFPTEHGRNVTKMISRARKALDLDYSFGCAPKPYWMTRSPYPGEDSIFSWLENEVLPDVVRNEERKDIPRLAILNTGAIRFDIFKGSFTRDTTYIVSPFLSGWRYVPDVPYDVAQKVIKLLNNGGKILDPVGLDSKLMAIPEQLHVRGSIIHDSVRLTDGISKPEYAAQKALGGDDFVQSPDLVDGYTTVDDLGADGDDAVHSPIDFYTVPNCIQAEIGFPEAGDPKTVDLVFIDFIQPWLLLALRFSGGDYEETDVHIYRNGTFTEMIAAWIKANWKGVC
jgi:hypothetical protein